MNIIHLTSFFANTQVKLLLICLIAIDIDSYPCHIFLKPFNPADFLS